MNFKLNINIYIVHPMYSIFGPRNIIAMWDRWDRATLTGIVFRK